MLLEHSRPQSNSLETPAMQPVTGGARHKSEIKMLSCIQAVRARLRALKYAINVTADVPVKKI
jgi:hypothetical protein